MPTRHPNQIFLIGGAYCLVVLALDWISDIGLYRGLGVTPWAPATGLGLAFSYIFRQRALPYLLIGEALIQLITSKVAIPLILSAALVPVNAGLLMLAGSALRRLPDFEPRIASVQSLLNLIGVGVCLACALSIVYSTALWISGLTTERSIYPISWRLVVGHLVGILVVAPLPIMLYAGWRLPRLSLLRVVQVLVLIAAIWVIFTYREASAYQLFYLLFLPLLWMAIRDGIGGAVIMLNLAQVGIIAGAQLRTDIVPGTGALQVLMIALALTGLLVGAIVTDRQAAGQRLRDQQAALNRALRLRSAGETAAAISHQINQPITAISTYSTVAMDALKNNNLELAHASLVKLNEECDRAATVARSIRDLVKQGSLSVAPTRVQDIVEALRSIHSAECTNLDIAFEIDLPGTLPTIMADRIQLEQALDNLITNSIESIKDAKRGNRIKLSAGIDGHDTFLEVEDNGPGFAPGLDALVTTPFMTTKLNGSGLGLAIARSVAEAHGGSLAIVRRSTGACVRLRLPTSGKKNG